MIWNPFLLYSDIDGCGVQGLGSRKVVVLLVVETVTITFPVWTKSHDSLFTRVTVRLSFLVTEVVRLQRQDKVDSFPDYLISPK